MLEQGISCRIFLVMFPERFDLLWKEAEYFYNIRSLNVVLQAQQMYSQNKRVSGYTEDMIEKLQTAFPFKKEYCNKGIWKSNPPFRKRILQKINNHGFMELIDSNGNSWYLDSCDRLNAFNFNQYTGWECSAGYRSLIIDTEGNIKRGHNCYEKPIGHIDKNFNLHSTIKPCITPVCSCTADNKIPKRKPGATRPSLFQIDQKKSNISPLNQPS